MKNMEGVPMAEQTPEQDMRNVIEQTVKDNEVILGEMMDDFGKTIDHLKQEHQKMIELFPEEKGGQMDEAMKVLIKGFEEDLSDLKNSRTGFWQKAVNLKNKMVSAPGSLVGRRK